MIANTLVFVFLLTAGGVFSTETNTCKNWLISKPAAISAFVEACPSELNTAIKNQPLPDILKKICAEKDKYVNDFSTALQKTTSCLRKTKDFQDKFVAAVNSLCDGSTTETGRFSCKLTETQEATLDKCWNKAELFTKEIDFDCHDFNTYIDCIVDALKPCQETHDILEKFVNEFRYGLLCLPKPTVIEEPKNNNNSTNGTVVTENKPNAASVSSTVPVLLSVAVVILQVVTCK